MRDQLRVYKIAPGRMDDFLDAHHKCGMLEIRSRFGFEFVNAWVVEEDNRFVWIVRHEGDADDFKAAEKDYYDSPDRKAMTPDPGQFVLESEVILMTPSEA